jgi:hypothetical protein
MDSRRIWREFDVNRGWLGDVAFGADAIDKGC